MLLGRTPRLLPLALSLEHGLQTGLCCRPVDLLVKLVCQSPHGQPSIHLGIPRLVTLASSERRYTLMRVPVGRWRRSTALLVLLTACPPGPCPLTCLTSRSPSATATGLLAARSRCTAFFTDYSCQGKSAARTSSRIGERMRSIGGTTRRAPIGRHPLPDHCLARIPKRLGVCVLQGLVPQRTRASLHTPDT